MLPQPFSAYLRTILRLGSLAMFGGNAPGRQSLARNEKAPAGGQPAGAQRSISNQCRLV